jgi:hypothetical protein
MDKKTREKVMFASLVEYVSDNVKAVLTREHDNCLPIVLAAYNRMQEDEFDGQNYIFNIHDDNDLKFLVDNKMITANKIAFVINEIPLGLFKFDDNGRILPAALDERELKGQLLQSLNFIVPYVLMYVTRCKEYQDFYEAFFTYFSENRLDPK